MKLQLWMIVCLTDIWTRYWLDAQGCDLFDNIVYQYNKKGILL